MSSLAQQHAALLAAVAERRDRQAFADLFDFYAPRVSGYLQRLGADRSSAEEMTQDVMVTLWRKAELFDANKSSVATWLFRIARNRRIDAGRRNRIDFLDPSDYLFDIADESNANADELIDGQFREEVLRRQMAGLPAEQLELVRLAFFDGLSHSEIAERTGLPLGTVKSRIRLAFTRLRRGLETGGVTGAT
jgi:RNA polymerase sigma factor (sigma-70 family)